MGFLQAGAVVYPAHVSGAQCAELGCRSHRLFGHFLAQTQEPAGTGVLLALGLGVVDAIRRIAQEFDNLGDVTEMRRGSVLFPICHTVIVSTPISRAASFWNSLTSSRRFRIWFPQV